MTPSDQVAHELDAHDATRLRARLVELSLRWRRLDGYRVNCADELDAVLGADGGHRGE